MLNVAQGNATLLWYSVLIFDLRFMNKINACSEETGLTIQNRIDLKFRKGLLSLLKGSAHTSEVTSPSDWSLRLVPGTKSLRVHYPF